jgi:hypothetical protein
MKKIIFKYLDMVFADAVIYADNQLIQAYTKNETKRLFIYYTDANMLRFNRIIGNNILDIFGIDREELFNYIKNYIIESLGHDILYRLNYSSFFLTT